MRPALLVVLVTAGCAALPAAKTPAATTAAAPVSGFSDVNTDPGLDTQARIAGEADDLLRAVVGLRRRVAELGGRVVREEVHYRHGARGAAPEAEAAFRIRLLPHALPDLLEWIGGHARITSEEVIAEAPSEPEVESALGGAAPPEAAAPARVSVVEVSLAEPADAIAEADVVPSLRGSWLGIVGGGSRLGAAVGVGIPSSALEIATYPAPPSAATGTPAFVVATLGAGLYAKAHGGGRRTWLNPYAGFRIGYAYTGRDQHRFVSAGELGLEIVKARGVVLAISARPMGLWGKRSAAALETGATLAMAF